MEDENFGVRNGWSITRVELFVVIAVIGVLVGVLLPAVWRVRTAARKTQSSNNLRQIALGALNYESAHMRFPSAGNPIKGGSEKFGWALAIVPYMESSNLVARVNEDEPWDSIGNSFVFGSALPFYTSPLERKSFNAAGYGVLHYAGCAEVIPEGVGTALNDDFDQSQFMFGEICDGYEPWAKPSGCRSFANGIQFDSFSFGSPAGEGALMARADGKVEFVSSSSSTPSQLFQGKNRNGITEIPNSYGYELILEYSPVLKGWRANCWFSPNSKGYGGGKALNDKGLKQLIQDDNVVALILGGAHKVSADGLKELKGSAVIRLGIDDRVGLTDEDLAVLYGLKQLKYLSLNGEQFSDEAIKEVRLALPDCEVVVR